MSSKPRFRTNPCVAVHLRDLKKADRFYRGVLGFKRIVKEKNLLGYDTGVIELYVDKGRKKMTPILSFTVKDIARAKTYLKKKGCKIVWEYEIGAYFKDPFGIVFDVIQGK